MFSMSMNLKPLQLVLPVPQVAGGDPEIHTAETLSHAAYHRDRSAFSSSQLKLILRSPLHFQHGLQAPHIEPPAMRIGTAIHTALLEPERFLNLYRVAPEKGRSAADKLAFANYVTAHPDKILISRSEMDMVEAVQQAVARHQLASRILRMGQAETRDRKSTRLNSSHVRISYAVFCLKKKKKKKNQKIAKYNANHERYRSEIIIAHANALASKNSEDGV